MTREKVWTAIDNSIPFEISMADGGKHAVSDRFRIAVGRKKFLLVGDRDCLASFRCRT